MPLNLADRGDQASGSRRVEGERRTGQRHLHRLRHDSELRSPAGRAVSGIKHGKSVQRHFCRTETRGRLGSIEFAKLEASAAGHRADFEREPERADWLMTLVSRPARGPTSGAWR